MARFRQILPAVSAVYFQRTSIWLATFFFLVSGVSIGAFTELALPSEEKTAVGTYLMEYLFLDGGQVNHSAVFFQSTGTNLVLLVLIFLSGLVPFGFPAAYAAVTYKGIALGFSSALLMESLGFQGVLTMVLTVLPPNLLILPALFLSVSAAVDTALSRRTGNRRKKSLSVAAGPYCFCFLIPLIIVLSAALFEAFISPALLQLIK